MSPPDDGRRQPANADGGTAARRDAPPEHVDGDGPTREDLSGDTVRDVVNLVREEDVPFRAAAVTYYALTSFVPLLIVSLSVLALIGAQDALVEALRSGVSGSTANVIDDALQTTRGAGGAGAIGFLVAVWSATKIFRGLSIAVAKIYDMDEGLSLVDQIRQGFVVLLFLLLAFAVVSATNVAIAAVPFDLPFPSLLWNLVALLGLLLGLLPLFYVLPPLDVSVRHALPGAVVAAIGWVLLQFGFSIYAANAGTYAAYGFLGAILLFTVLLYFAANVLLLGATVNVVLDR